MRLAATIRLSCQRRLFRDGIAFRRGMAVFGSALFLAGCQKFSPDRGMEPVAVFSNQELKMDIVAIRSEEDALAARSAVKGLLKRPLTAGTAVQIALLNNRGLQAAYNELAIAEAMMVGASLPPNPIISLSQLTGSGAVEIERRIVADILALATLPARAEVAGDRFRQAQLRAIAETLRVAADTRRVYYRAVTLRELASFLVQAQSAAEVATQLAKRLGETGALNKLDQAREQVFYADITVQLAAARQRAASERERLIRLLGLWGSDLDFQLPSALPSLPARPRTLPAVEIEAIRRRVDLQITRIEVDTLAKSYGLTQATRFINLLDVAGISRTTRDPGGDPFRQRGIEVEFQVPLFDFGQVRVRAAEQTYLEAVNRLSEKAINVRSEARDAYRSYRSTYDVAAHYQREVLPLHQIISEEMMLRYGAMQIDVFSLLAEARQRLNTTMAAIEARRDFWLASTDLMTAVIGGGVGSVTSENLRPMATTETGAAGH